jgi:hypothetical protein
MSQERNTERRMKIRNYIAKLRILRKAAWENLKREDLFPLFLHLIYLTIMF